MSSTERDEIRNIWYESLTKGDIQRRKWLSATVTATSWSPLSIDRNEDRFLLHGASQTAFVVDGMGGLRGSKEFSNRFIKYLDSLLQSFNTSPQTIISDIVNIVIKASKAVSNEHPRGNAVAAFASIVEDQIIFGNIGDCRAYYSSGQNNISVITKDHIDGRYIDFSLRALAEQNDAERLIRSCQIQPWSPGSSIGLLTDGAWRSIPQSIPTFVEQGDIDALLSQSFDQASRTFLVPDDGMTAVIMKASR